MSCVGEVSIATLTQLNSTRQREQLSPISSERRDPVRVSIATQLNSTSSGVELCRRSVYSDADATQLDVELSCVELRCCKRALMHYTICLSVPCLLLPLQEAELSQRDHTSLRVIEYFAKSLKVIRNDTVE